MLTNASGGSWGGARGGRASPLFLDQTEARRVEKKFLGDPFPRPHYLRNWTTGPLLPYLKV